MAGEGGAAVLQVVVQNLIDLSKNEISLIRGLDREAQNLIQNLDTIQQFLNDAETQTIPTGAVKSWLKRLENAAFEADNVLDELHYHSLSKAPNTDIKKKKVLITCFSPFIDYARKRKMAVKIQEINMNLDSINNKATELGLQKKLVDAPTVPDAGMETDSFSADPIFIGRDDLVSEIVETLITSVVTSLQTLPGDFIVRDTDGYKIKELGSLNNLKGQLRIKGLEKVHDKEEAEKANLSKKSKLSELILEWTSSREEVESINDENVLEGLQPHSNLKKLRIGGFYGKRFSLWIMNIAARNEPQGSWVGLDQLVEIEFYRCTECEEIPMLGHLPNLKSLCLGDLSNVKSINSSFYGIGNETGVVFPVLETLELSDMDSLKEWAEVESGSTSEVKVFPHLRSLKISNCNQLMKVPFNQLQSSCLESMELSGCNQLTTDCYLSLLSKLTSLTSLVLEGLESLPVELFYNNPNLFVLKIRQCPKLREIPFGRRTANSLYELIIEECPDLKRIGLMDYPFEIGGFSCLTQLGIRECHGLMDFPYELLESWALKKVALEGLSSLSNLPRLIECLAKSTAHLMELRIVGVPKFLATSVDQVWHFPNLERLVIDVSMEGSREKSVATLDRILQGCSRNSLRELYLTGMDSWECLPESIQHLTSLYRLELNNFGMEELPEWFDQFISDTYSWLFNLKLSECKRLRRLPSTHAMRLLIEEKRVHITGCPKLTTTK